jgi:hypothetical protein
MLLEALSIQKRVLGEDHPDVAILLYNLATLEALRGNQTKGLAWLRESIEAGFSWADYLCRDSDLEALHGPEFDALAESARRNAVTQRAR